MVKQAQHTAVNAPSLVRNTAFNIADTGLRLGLGILLSPVLFHSLGAGDYGLWSVIWSFSSTLGVLDPGLGAAMTPLVARAAGEDARERVTRLVNTGFFVYCLLGGLLILLTWFAMHTPSLVRLLPERIAGQISFAVPAAVAAFVITVLTTMVNGVLNGLQRYDLSARQRVVTTILRAGLLVGAAMIGGRLRTFVGIEVAMCALGFVLASSAAFRELPGYRFRPWPSRLEARQLLAFGVKLEVAHMAHLVGFHLDKFLLTAFLGLEAVAWYDLGSKIVHAARMLPLLLVSATTPVATRLSFQPDADDAFLKFYLQGNSLLAWTGLPLFLWAALAAKPLLFAWAGVSAWEAQATVQCLAFGFFLNVYSGMANSIVIGVGQPEVEMRRSILAGLLNVLLSAGLIQVLGFTGAPLGTSIAFAVGAIYLLAVTNRFFNRRVIHIGAELALPLLAALPAGGCAILIINIMDRSTRPAAACASVMAAVVIGLVYLLCGWCAGVFRREFLVAVRKETD